MTTSTDKQQHFISLLHDFRFGMFTTHDEHERPRARPMAIADVEDNGNVWLITNAHSAKVDESRRDAYVGLTMQEGQKFVSVSGTVTIVRDPAKLDALWSEAWKVWFPKGKSDPDIVLVRINVQQGEFWDNSGIKQIGYLYEAAKAYVQGRKPEVDEDAQGKVTLKSP